MKNQELPQQNLNQTVAGEMSPDLDINYQAFQQMKADEKWLNEHLGYYVAFVDGKLVGEDRDRYGLLLQIRNEFPKKPKFFTLVELEEKIIDIAVLNNL